MDLTKNLASLRLCVKLTSRKNVKMPDELKGE